jgi:hypothetical protein
VIPLRSDAEQPVDDPRLAALRAMPYSRYLRTPEWKWTRATALELAGHRCAANPAHTEDLGVYHRSFDRQGAERSTDLTVLCRTCRLLYHRDDGRPHRERPAPRPRRGAQEPRPSLLKRLLG